MTESLKLKKNSITYEDVQMQDGQTRLLILSDLHIGMELSVDTGINLLMQKLNEAISLTNPDVVCIAGDIRHSIRSLLISAYVKVFDKLSELPIPVYAIPGNHDRINAWRLTDYSKGNFHFLNVDIIRFVFPNGAIVIAGHHLSNDLKVHGKTSVRKWITTMRRVFNEIIPDTSYLILGHVHEYHSYKDIQSWTLLPFSADLNSFQYAIVTAVDLSANVSCNSL